MICIICDGKLEDTEQIANKLIIELEDRLGIITTCRKCFKIISEKIIVRGEV